MAFKDPSLHNPQAFLDAHHLGLDAPPLEPLLALSRDEGCSWAEWALLARLPGRETAYTASFANARAVRGELTGGNEIACVADLCGRGSVYMALATLVYAPRPLQDCLTEGARGEEMNPASAAMRSPPRPAIPRQSGSKSHHCMRSFLSLTLPFPSLSFPCLSPLPPLPPPVCRTLNTTVCSPGGGASWACPLSVLESGMSRHPSLLRWLADCLDEDASPSLMSGLTEGNSGSPGGTDLVAARGQADRRRDFFSSGKGDVGLLDLLRTFVPPSSDMMRMVELMVEGSTRVWHRVLNSGGEGGSGERGANLSASTPGGFFRLFEESLLGVLSSEFFHVDPEQVPLPPQSAFRFTFCSAQQTLPPDSSLPTPLLLESRPPPLASSPPPPHGICKGNPSRPFAGSPLSPPLSLASS